MTDVSLVPETRELQDGEGKSARFGRFQAVLGKPVAQENKVTGVLFAVRADFHASKQARRCKWNAVAVFDADVQAQRL